MDKVKMKVKRNEGREEERNGSGVHKQESNKIKKG